MLFTFRGSGVLNLAHGSMALYPTYVYAELRDTGDVVLPGVPGSVHVGDIGVVPSLAIALVAAAAVGLGAYAVVFRQLRRRAAPPLASIVAAVGVHIVLEVVVILRHDATPRLMPSVLPQHSFTVAGTSVPADRAYTAAIVVLVGVAAAFVQQRTRFGLASRAMAENDTATALLGYSPDRLGALNWMIGAVLAGVFGILLGPITGLNPQAYSFLIVPALATVVAAAFSSTTVVVGVGLALGITQSQLTRVQLPVEWLGPQVLREVVPFVALALVVAWRGSVLPSRGAAVTWRLPRANEPAHPARLVGMTVVMGAAAVALSDGGYRAAVITTMIGALACLSLVVLTGFAGQVSLAQLSFAGVSAFVLSSLTRDAGVAFPLAPVLAALAATVCGVVVGFPALRARGAGFAVLTLGGALAINELVFRNLSNGVLKANTVEPPRIGGLDLTPTGADGTPRGAFGLFVLVVLGVSATGVLALRRSHFGRQLLAVRSNERAAAAAGINVTAAKLSVFGLSAFIAGMAGALQAYHQGVVSSGSYTLGASFVALAAAYLGGIGSVAGALIGGLIVTGGIVPLLLDRTLHIGEYQVLLSGVAMIAVATRSPEGVAAAWRHRASARGRTV